MKKQTAPLTGVVRAKKGAVLVEYAMILAFAGIPAFIGIGKAGEALLLRYKIARTYFVIPVP
jgi:hypothetical protein